MDYDEALAFLDEHTNLERMMGGRIDAPSLERMRRLTSAMGDPQRLPRSSTSPARTARARRRR